ncbi:MAG: hypothetical protein ACYDEV_08555 [Acidiferrobacter sp.]
MSMHIKTISIRLIIVLISATVTWYEPGLAVFAIAGGVAALIIVRDAGKLKAAKVASSSACEGAPHP